MTWLPRLWARLQPTVWMFQPCLLELISSEFKPPRQLRLLYINPRAGASRALHAQVNIKPGTIYESVSFGRTLPDTP